MNFADPSTALLAACGGDSVKVFDVSEDTGSDPCMLSYSPSPGFQVNSVKWNHTNLVIASAGDDKRISLWRKNGQSMGTVPPLGTNAGDNIDESISAISFSNKGSRYLCSGGSGQIVRVWDLQRKRCIKWLRGHTDTITGVMCNCKDEHLASISLKGDLILHNLASGARAAELKDPNEQVLRVLDYSRISRHVLVTAGDNGSVHLWDTTGRSPKVSWLKQHSAPTTGVCFSPSNDKMIASVGLDKKLYTFDSGTRRPTSCVPYEAPFSSLAFRDDGWTLAAGTSSGRVVFYDVRGKPQPYTVLRAYSSSEAITSLCWQRSKPINVNESTCTAETALLGGSEDSILMPDPLPSLTSSSLSSSTAVSTTRNSGRPMSSIDASPLTTTSSGSISTAEVTPQRNHLSTGGGLSRLHPPRSSLNLSDDMEVFSPLVDVQPITPSLSNWWSDQNETKKDNATNEKKSASLVFPLSGRKFPYTEEGNMDFHQISDWKSNPALRQDDTQSTVSQPSATSSKSEQSFNATPPEAWGGEALSDKLSHHRSALSKPSRFVTTSGSLTSGALMSSSTFAGLQESSASTSHTAISSLTNTSLITNLHGKDISNHEALSGLSEPSSTFPFSSIVSSLGTKNSSGQANLDVPGLMSVALPRRYSTYADRISTISSFSDGASYGLGSPKLKKTGAETREELVNSLLSRSDTSGAAGMGALPIPNGVTSQPQKGLAQPDHQQQGASSFTLQGSMFLELALVAMDELVKMVQTDEPLWIPSLDGGKETLNYEEYVRSFPRCIRPKPVGFVTEASRDNGMVIINSMAFVETLMDANRWAQMFPCIIARASTADVISSGMCGTRNGVLHLMHAELHVLSPLVPIREVNFLRFCKQHADGVWAVVDVSIDGIRENPTASTYINCRRLPSGCVVQDMPNGYSKVTWVEHAEYDESAVHQLYRRLLSSGMGFGAQRWVATLQRECQCLAILMSSAISGRDHTTITPSGRRSMLKLAQRMTNNFCAGVCASTVHKWNKLCVGNVDEDVRVMTRKSVDDPGEPPGIVLSAATSVWLPVSPSRLFDFLRDERLRSEWDILSNGGPMQEMAHIAKGQDHGNCVSLLRASAMNANQSSMLILQETCVDAAGALVVYAPVDIPAMHVVMNGGDSAYVALLPSGFAIVPDGPGCGPYKNSTNSGNQKVGGSLLTVAFQILVNHLPTAKLTDESVDTVNNLISCTVQKIKGALHCEN